MTRIANTVMCFRKQIQNLGRWLKPLPIYHAGRLNWLMMQAVVLKIIYNHTNILMTHILGEIIITQF